MRPQAWWTPIGLLAVIGPSRNDQRGLPRFFGRSFSKAPISLPELEDGPFLGREIDLRVYLLERHDRPPCGK